MSFIISNIPGQVSTITVPPDNYEISLPLRVDSAGRVATVSTTVAKAIQHLLSLALTAPGERVMRPNYGVGIQQLVFENSSMAEYQSVARLLQQAYMSIESDYVTNVSVSVVQTPNKVILFQVSFTLANDTRVHQALFNYAGQLVGSS